MQINTSFTTNTSKSICEAVLPRGKDFYVATVLVSGTFGGGTLSFFLSPDRGTTLVPLTSTPGGTQASLTAPGMLQVNTGHPSAINLGSLTVWATLAGATTPSINVVVFDNHN